MDLFDYKYECPSHFKEDAERYWGAVQKVWDTKLDGRASLIETEVGDWKIDTVDVKVQELGLQGRRPVKKRCTCSDCGR